MKIINILLVFCFAVFCNSTLQSQWSYPVTRIVDSTETYFGETLKDPYQWLENMESTEVTEWFRTQAAYCDEVIGKIPNRDKLIQELSELDKVKEVYYSSIRERNGNYFFNKRMQGEEMNKLYMRKGKNGSDELLFDPQNYDAGKKYTLGGWIISDNGKNVLIEITEKGKERPFLKILNTETKTFYIDELKTSSASRWLEGSDNTFMYQKYQGEDIHKMESTMDTRVFLHTLGKNTSEDKELLSRVHDPSLGFKPEEYPFINTDHLCNYIFAGKGTVDRNQELYYAPKSQLTSGNIDWKPFCKREDKITSIIGYKDEVYMLTSRDAVNFKIVKTSLSNPDIKSAQLIFSGNDKKITSLRTSKDYMIITQMHNGVQSYISKLNFESGKVETVEIPLKGTISVNPYSPFSNECSVANSDWTIPANIYSISLNDNSFSKGVFNIEFKYPGIENLTAEEIEVSSHDGVKVPLTIIYDKTKLKKDGSNICFLTGYGAYGSSRNPAFNTFMLPMIGRGVVYAVAHVRGGGEKGEDWHRAGWKTTKPNTWKDFIACGDYLVNNGYTSKDKLAGTGGSAGGILIGRAITERPDLFKVAVPQVGSMNPLRMEFSPNGPVNVPEFGTVTIEEEYRALKEMDSYENLIEGEKYPATLITTGFNDPRVISWVPAKFAAKMQFANTSDNPILLHVDFSTGHFGGETMSSRFKNISDVYSFILWQCGDPEFQPKAN